MYDGPRSVEGDAWLLLSEARRSSHQGRARPNRLGLEGRPGPPGSVLTQPAAEDGGRRLQAEADRQGAVRQVTRDGNHLGEQDSAGARTGKLDSTGLLDWEASWRGGGR